MTNDDETLTMQPPAHKKKRMVDLSYVPISRGVVFLSDDDDDREQFIPFQLKPPVETEASMPSQVESVACAEDHRSPCKRTDDSSVGYHERHSIPTSLSDSGDGLRGVGSFQISTDQLSDERDEGSCSTGTEQKRFADFKCVDTRFSDIIGHDDVKVRIDELLLPLALPPSLVQSVLKGVRSFPASILLYGPPGCGKTQLARAIAGESQAAFLSIGPSDVLSKFVGEAEASLRALFLRASDIARTIESRCTILFFDEIDALGYSRGDESGKSIDGDGSRRILAELLIQLSNLSTSQQHHQKVYHERNGDGRDDDDNESLEESVRIMVVAATNRISDCDPALIRRFAIQILVGLPSLRDRRKIFQKLLQDFEHNLTKEDLKELALATEGWSGSELESLTREAAMAPIRECLRVASKMKRKARRMEQQGGVESAQEAIKSEDALRVAKQVLMDELQKIRPVTRGDFQAAMAFLLTNCSAVVNDDISTCDSSSDSEGSS